MAEIHELPQGMPFLQFFAYAVDDANKKIGLGLIKTSTGEKDD